jgi:hypothetical protein
MNSNESKTPLISTAAPRDADSNSDLIIEAVIGTLHLNLTQPECSGRLG